MAETQEKRTDDSGATDTKNTDNKNQTSNSAQSGAQANTSGENNSTNAQTANQSGATSDALTGARGIYDQAKETAGQAFGKVSEQATTQIDTQKENLVRGLTSVADSIRQMGENLRGGEQQTPIAGFTAKYGDSLATQVEQVSNYLEKKDLREVVKDVETFARRNPAVFIGGAFALGIVAARFLKSGNPNQALMRRPRREREGIYIPDRSEGVYLPEDLGKKVGLAGNERNSSSAPGASDNFSTDAFSPNKGG